MWYGPPGSVMTPLKISLYYFNMYSFVIGSLCTLPFSSMDSGFHLTLGTTGSSVCFDCFSSMALLDSLLWASCPCLSFGLSIFSGLLACPPYSSICTLSRLRHSSHSLLNSSLTWWTGRMLHPAPVSISHFVCCITESLDCATHSGLMCSLFFCFMYWRSPVVWRHFTDVFSWLKKGTVDSL